MGGFEVIEGLHFCFAREYAAQRFACALPVKRRRGELVVLDPTNLSILYVNNDSLFDALRNHDLDHGLQPSEHVFCALDMHQGLLLVVFGFALGELRSSAVVALTKIVRELQVQQCMDHVPTNLVVALFVENHANLVVAERIASFIDPDETKRFVSDGFVGHK